MKRKANFYIDGFNLYYALKENGLYNYIWLDLVKLCRKLVKHKTEVLGRVNYFTTVPPTPVGRRKRHIRFLNALQASSSDIQIFHGKFYNTTENCPNCKIPYYVSREKRTDVNLACQVIKMPC